MPSIKTVAAVVALATSVAAYSAPLEARSDLDFTPDDLEILFGRDIDSDSDDLGLLARELDFDAEDLDILIARSGGSSLMSTLGKGFSHLRKHKKGISKTLNRGADLYSNHQSIKAQKLQNQQTAQYQPQDPQAMQPQDQGGQFQARDFEEDILARDLEFDARDLFDEEDTELFGRDLFEEEDPEVFY